jgi:hypothetical protein
VRPWATTSSNSERKYDRWQDKAASRITCYVSASQSVSFGSDSFLINWQTDFSCLTTKSSWPQTLAMVRSLAARVHRWLVLTVYRPTHNRFSRYGFCLYITEKTASHIYFIVVWITVATLILCLLCRNLAVSVFSYYSGFQRTCHCMYAHNLSVVLYRRKTRSGSLITEKYIFGFYRRNNWAVWKTYYVLQWYAVLVN